MRNCMILLHFFNSLIKKCLKSISVKLKENKKLSVPIALVVMDSDMLVEK